MNRKAESELFTAEEIENNHNAWLKRQYHYKKFGLNQVLLRERVANQIDSECGSVLEVGTGKGYLTTMIARGFDRVVSVDNTRTDLRIAMLNAAQSRCLHKIEFLTADAGSLDFAGGSFDAVVSAFTFHHLDLPFKVVREMARLAKNQVIISDFTERGFHVVEQVHRQEGRGHERKPVDFDIVGVYLKECGFEVRVIEDEWQIIYSARRRMGNVKS